MPRSTVKDEVVALVVEMLCKRWHKCQIKQALSKGNADPQVGPVFDPIIKHWTIERYVSLARERIRGSLDQKLHDRVAQSIEFYEATIRDPKTITRDKLLAQERIDKLLGLDLVIVPADANAKKPEADRQIDATDLTIDEWRVLSKLKNRLAIRN